MESLGSEYQLSVFDETDKEISQKNHRVDKSITSPYQYNGTALSHQERKRSPYDLMNTQARLTRNLLDSPEH
jgi:hypothetical protein